jgi:hypothetical protein
MLLEDPQYSEYSLMNEESLIIVDSSLDIDMQSTDDEDDSIEVSSAELEDWANPGTTAAATPPATSNAAIIESSFFIVASSRVVVLPPATT